MNPINSGNGYLSDVISVAVVAFLILLAAFIAANVIIACRYHASKHALAEGARCPQGHASGADPAAGMVSSR